MVTDHVNERQLNRCKVFNLENGMELCQLNFQVLWPSITSRSTVRLHWPPTMFETITPGRGVQRKKQTPRNCRRVQMKKQKLEIVIGERMHNLRGLLFYKGYPTTREGGGRGVSNAGKSCLGVEGYDASVVGRAAGRHLLWGEEGGFVI